MHISVSSPLEAQKFSSMLNKGDWLVLYYADWCGHCKDMKPEWHKTIEHLKSTNKNIHVGEIESEHIPALTNKPEIVGFPTIKMYNQGKEVANFMDQPRDSQNITKFAMDNSSKSTVHHTIHHRKPVHTIQHRKPVHTMQHRKPVHSAPSHKKHSHTKRKITHHHKSHRKSHRKSHSKTYRKSHHTAVRHRTSKTTQGKATKDIFSELIKSFSRIGKEARTDAQILREAKEKL